MEKKKRGALEMAEFDKTMMFSRGKEIESPVRSIMKQVISAMEERGYDPIDQLVGYIVSGDPTYVTAYKNARTLIRKIDKDELLEEVVSYYIKSL